MKWKMEGWKARPLYKLSLCFMHACVHPTHCLFSPRIEWMTAVSDMDHRADILVCCRWPELVMLLQKESERSIKCNAVCSIYYTASNV